MFTFNEWRRALWAGCAVAGAWTAVVALTGGFAYRSGWVRISSQNPIDPAMIAVTCAVLAITPDWRASRRQNSAAAMLVLAVTGIGIALVVSQWLDARPLWLDEEMIALNYRDRSF